MSARKSLGQNFLLDLNLTARIARAAGPLEGATIIEVGPGPGGLTRALLALGARRVIAVERDERALARDAVRQSLVLLKNNGVLPMKASANILVAGSGADVLVLDKRSPGSGPGPG